MKWRSPVRTISEISWIALVQLEKAGNQIATVATIACKRMDTLVSQLSKLTRVFPMEVLNWRESFSELGRVLATEKTRKRNPPCVFMPPILIRIGAILTRIGAI